LGIQGQEFNKKTWHCNLVDFPSEDPGEVRYNDGEEEDEDGEDRNSYAANLDDENIVELLTYF